MNRFSSTDRKIIASIVEGLKEACLLVDFLKPDFPQAHLVINGYLQHLAVTLAGKTEMKKVMAHLVQVLRLLEFLEKEGYLMTWTEQPQPDQQQSIGEPQAEASPQFLPDFQIAVKLLQYANKRMLVHPKLKVLVKNQFRSELQQDFMKAKPWLIAGFIVIIGLCCWLTFMHTRLESRQKSMKHEVKMMQAKLQDLSIDHQALLTQTDKLRASLNAISMNQDQERVELSELSDQIRDQNAKYNGIRKNMRLMAQDREKNRQIFIKIDSLLNN